MQNIFICLVPCRGWSCAGPKNCCDTTTPLRGKAVNLTDGCFLCVQLTRCFPQPPPVQLAAVISSVKGSSLGQGACEGQGRGRARGAELLWPAFLFLQPLVGAAGCKWGGNREQSQVWEEAWILKLSMALMSCMGIAAEKRKIPVKPVIHLSAELLCDLLNTQLCNELAECFWWENALFSWVFLPSNPFCQPLPTDARDIFEFRVCFWLNLTEWKQFKLSFPQAWWKQVGRQGPIPSSCTVVWA